MVADYMTNPVDASERSAEPEGSEASPTKPGAEGGPNSPSSDKLPGAPAHDGPPSATPIRTPKADRTGGHAAGRRD